MGGSTFTYIDAAYLGVAVFVVEKLTLPSVLIENFYRKYNISHT
jgi:hypothetical protein